MLAARPITWQAVSVAALDDIWRPSTVNVRWLTLVTVSLLVAFWPADGWAGRPLDTEDTGTLDPGQFQLELGQEYVKETGQRSWATIAGFSAGVLKGLEVKIESAVLLLEPDGERSRAGVSDSVIGAKYRLLDETDTWPAMVAAFKLKLPTGDARRGLGDDDVEAAGLAALGKTVGPVTMTVNVGYPFVTRRRELDAWTLSGSIEYPVTAALTAVAELVGTIGVSEAEDTLVARAGAVFALTKRVSLDGAVGMGLTRASQDLITTVGITVRF
jgi:Putative MetA-pathway of phenol degradation